MAKRIKWSRQAIADRIQILDYWFQRIGNKGYSKKLDKSLEEIIKLLSEYPELGRKVANREERYFVKDCYQIFYQVEKNSIEILHIFAA